MSTGGINISTMFEISPVLSMYTLVDIPTPVEIFSPAWKLKPNNHVLCGTP